MRRFSLFAVLLLLAVNALAAGPADREIRASGRIMILEAEGPLTPADRAELADKGIVVKRPLRGNEYLARIADNAITSDARVKAVSAIRVEDKIDRLAWREAARGATWADVTVMFHDEVSVDEARSAILSAGGALADPFELEFGPMRRIAAKISPSQLTALAADERVFAVLGPLRFKVQPHNIRSAAASQVTDVQAAPYNLTGAGVNVSLFELGVAQTTHPEFEDRFSVAAEGGGSSNRAHATHVAGTITAAGIRSDAKGMAPKAKLFQFCISTPCTDTSNLTFLDDKDEALVERGITIDNNSWGFVLGWCDSSTCEGGGYWVWTWSDVLWGAYDLTATAPIDEISIDRGVLFVHSAGNDGSGITLGAWGEHRHEDQNPPFNTLTDKLFCYSMNGSGSDCPAACNGGCEATPHHAITPFDTMGLTAAGKNTLAVGAIQLLGEAPNFSKQIAGFSSRGPAKDGRVKPDIVARGVGVLSTVPTNAYGPNNGTSMAAPAVTGIAALLTEQWKKTFGAQPRPDQLKAVILAGAEDLGNPGPDYTYGFGLANAKSSADLIIADDNKGRGIRNLSVTTGSTTEIPMAVTAGQNVRVLVNWADPAIPFLPGRPDIAEKALVNDLDLKVIAPSGDTILPYVLDKNNVNANATKGVNTVDNVELVELPTAGAGTYRIVVTGTIKDGASQSAVLVTNAALGAACKDLTESNDTPGGAYGNLVPNQSVVAGICATGDIDYFKFEQAGPGTVRVIITTGDTPLRFTLSGAASGSIDVAANSTATLTSQAAAAGPITVKVEATGAVGINPSYSFTPQFTQQTGNKRRSVRK